MTSCFLSTKNCRHKLPASSIETKRLVNAPSTSSAKWAFTFLVATKILLQMNTVDAFSVARARSDKLPFSHCYSDEKGTRKTSRLGSLGSNYLDQINAASTPPDKDKYAAETESGDTSVTEMDPRLDAVYQMLGDVYGTGTGREQMRRMNAAMARSTYLQSNPDQDKRHMTYGEMSLELFDTTLQRLAALTERPGSFVDLGSGVGRLTLAASMLAPQNVWQESVGIEIVPDLHQTAMEAMDRSQEYWSSHLALPIQFFKGDAFDPSNAVLNEASALYAYSTTWECDENLCMNDLSNSLAKTLGNGALAAVTDRKLAEPFSLLESIEGTNAEKGGYTATSIVNIYKLVK